MSITPPINISASELPTTAAAYQLPERAAVLLVLIFSKFFYLASINSYLIFYLMHQYGLSTQTAQYHLFYFLVAVAAGGLLGGPIGDRIGRRQVIWASILGVAPFTLLLPYVGPTMSVVLTMIIGFMLSSAFPATPPTGSSTGESPPKRPTSHRTTVAGSTTVSAKRMRKRRFQRWVGGTARWGMMASVLSQCAPVARQGRRDS